jgi:predicted ATP-dependent protease
MQNLMLKEEVVDDVKVGKFHIYAVDSIDEGIEVLTGVTSEEVNRKVNKRLSSMIRKFRGMAGLIEERRRKQ